MKWLGCLLGGSVCGLGIAVALGALLLMYGPDLPEGIL